METKSLKSTGIQQLDDTESEINTWAHFEFKVLFPITQTSMKLEQLRSAYQITNFYSHIESCMMLKMNNLLITINLFHTFLSYVIVNY